MPFFGGGDGDYHIIVTNIKGGTDAAPAVIGDNNMALGNGAGQLLLNADANVIIGNNAGQDFTEGASNVFIGYNAFQISDGTPIANVAIGQDALSNSSFDVNSVVAIGYQAGQNSGGTGNVLIGATAGNNFIGSNSVCMGAESGQNSMGESSVSLGFRALYSQSASEFATFNADGTVAIGYNAGASNFPDDSTADRLFENAVFIGKNAAYQNTPNGNSVTAVSAIVIGAESGKNEHSTDMLDITDSIVIGHNSGNFLEGMLSGDQTNNIIIGNYISADTPNNIIIGDEFHTSIFIGGIDFSGGPGAGPDFNAGIGLNGVTAGASGVGFPAVAVESADPNTLDDYEEGVFTPTFTCTTPGDLSVAYTTQLGAYSKIGKYVYFSIRIGCTPTFSTATGAIRIAGLPFAVLNSSLLYQQFGSFSMWNAPANFYSMFARSIANQSYLQFFRQSVTNTGVATTEMTEIVSGTAQSIVITGFYEVQ